MSPFVKQTPPVPVGSRHAAVATSIAARQNLYTVFLRTTDGDFIFILFQTFLPGHEMTCIRVVGPPIFPTPHD